MTSKQPLSARTLLENGDKDRMLEMSIRQLAEATGGQLTMSGTPPLGGLSEPIGRIRRDSDECCHGDVVFSETENTCLEVLQLQGAMGVISTRTIAPQAGCFAIRVRNVSESLRRFAAVRRQQLIGRLVVSIVPEDCPPLAWQLATLAESKDAGPVHIKANPRDAMQLRWCDADEVLIDGRLDAAQRSFVVTYLPTNAPIRLAG